MAGRIGDSQDTSIVGAILATAARTRSGPALSTPVGSFTSDELAGTAFDLAGSLRERYPGETAPFLIVMSGDPWTLAALLAADLVGRTAVLLHPSSTSEEIRLAAVASRAKLLLQHDGGDMTLYPGGASFQRLRGLAWTDLPAQADGATVEQVRTNSPPGLLAHGTSGTMASSKLALRTRSAVLTEIDALRRVLSLTEQDVVLCASAVSHSYGCIGGLLAPLLAGSTVRIARNTMEALAAIVESEPSIVFGLGPMYAALTQTSHELHRALRKVRFAFTAGAPLPAGVYERFRAQWGVSIRQDYGTSETGTISLDLEETPQPETVGRPLPHVEVRLLPPEAIPLEMGEVGEIQVRSPALARGYLVDGRLEPCVDEEGWYATQDAGSWMDRRLRVHRRLRPLPFIQGESVYLDRVERTIAALPGVIEVVVVAETGLTGAGLVAMVATRDRTADEVRVWCSERLPNHWVPTRFVICENLPRSPAGKVLSRYL